MLVPTSNITGQGSPSNSQEEENDQLNAGKIALRQLLKEKKNEKKKKYSLFSLLRLYLTILGGLLISFGLLILMFLVPMTIDPALATITYNISHNEGLCITTEVIDNVKVLGTNGSIENMKLCACSEGCTKEIFSCYQIIVSYNKTSPLLKDRKRRKRSLTAAHRVLDEDLQQSEDMFSNAIDYPSEIWSYNSKDHSVSKRQVDNSDYSSSWDVNNASLYVNVKGCGYQVNCTDFKKWYGVPGRRFFCHYSQVDPQLVVDKYDPEKAWTELVMSLGYTLGAQIGGVILIVVMNCPYKSMFRAIARRRALIQAK